MLKKKELLSIIDALSMELGQLLSEKSNDVCRLQIDINLKIGSDNLANVNEELINRISLYEHNIQTLQNDIKALKEEREEREKLIATLFR
jgi:hypothetical protein